MQRVRILVAVLGVGLLVTMAGAPAIAQQANTPPVIAFVDLEGILRDSLAALAARQQLSEIWARYQEEISVDETALRTAEQELQQQRTLLAPELFAERQRELQQRIGGLQQKVRGVRRAMDEALAKTMEGVQQVLFEEVGRIAQERGINVVLRRSQIVLAANEFDITAEALVRLNERLPTVGIEITATPAEQQ